MAVVLDAGKASDIAQPGGFRRDHVITNLPGSSPHVPSYMQETFLESIQPTPGFLQSAYGDFIVASLGLADDDDDSDVRDRQDRWPVIRWMGGWIDWLFGVVQYDRRRRRRC
jgi:hypothetical protein